MVHAPLHRIRNLAIAWSAALSGLTLIASVALVVSTYFLARSASALADGLESIRATSDLETNLLMHVEKVQALESGRGSWDRQSLSEVEAQILEARAQARTNISSATERRLVEQAEARLDDYLGASAGARAGRSAGPGAEGPELLAARLALDAVQRLAEGNHQDSHLDEARAKRWQTGAEALAGLVSLSMLGILALFHWSLRARVYLPLLELREALRRFSEGDRRAQTAVRGVAEIQEIGETFNAMVETIEHQQKAQVTFLASVAHDLLNPLSGLKLAAGMVKADRELPPEASLRRIFGLVGGQVESLSRMVKDLLDTTRIEAGELELRLEAYDLRELAARSLELYRSVSAKHRLELSAPEGLPRVHCDPVRMEQVLNNLLSNAIKYSPEGGPVRVELQQREGWALVSVSDQGRGIAPEDQQRVFEPFQRVSLDRDGIPGAGLGLSVVSRIVEAHGGSIELESLPGVGSTFRIRLPLARLEPAVVGPVASGEPSRI